MAKEIPTIFLASDHAGFKLKEKLKDHLVLKGYAIFDCGPFKLNPQDDYPDFIIPCAKKVSKAKNSLGIVLGLSGQGEAVAANKIKGIRAVTIYSVNPKIVMLSRQHNNSNILSLGAGFLTEKQALFTVDLWLSTEFSNEPRHKRRLSKLEK